MIGNSSVSTKHPSAFLWGLVLITLLTIASAQSVIAQKAKDAARGTLAGRITERVTGQAIVGARVAVEGQGETVTDQDGAYRMELPPGTYTVHASARGYAPVVINDVAITDHRTTLNDLRLDVFLSEKVEVKSGYFPEDASLPVSSVKLGRAEIRSTPGTGGDVLRVIDAQPGVTNASGEFADLIVRGGAVGENLTFIDNIPVGDFTYFTDQYDNGRGGRIALLAPDAIERIEFSAGGFGVRYGDRMSSALDITLRKAARDRVQGTAFIDSGSFGASVEVPLGARGGWLFTARRSYIDIAFDIFNIGEIGRPRDFDFINKIDYDLSPRHKISFTALNLFERYTSTLAEALKIPRRVDQFVAERSGRRAILGLTLSSTFGTKTFSQLTAWGAGAHNDGRFLRALSFNSSFTVFRVDGQTLQRQRDLRDSEFGLKEELTASLSPHLNLAAGGGLYFQQANYFTFERSPAGFSPIAEEFFAPTRSNRMVIGTTASGYGYAQATWLPTPRLSLTPGVRVDRYGITSETLFSPRMSARLRLTPRLALNAAAGVYRQPPSLFAMSLAPENRALKAQRAVHAVAGLEWLVREDVRLSVEAYEKSYDNLVVRPTLTSPLYFNTGEGEARGLDIVLQKALTGRFGGEAIYSFTRSRRRFTSSGFSFPSDTERPHQLTLVGITRLFGFNLAGKLRVASGLPYTLYTPVQFRPGIFLQVLNRPEDRNAGRLPLYAQFDMRAERRFSFKRWSFAPYI
ncbi:MAG: TonB-dependent receptor, partial [Acidobacteriota bacterium]|nr:TonB-dependent receptor [Acidobacteriota bacterium]